jgi:tetratricopeptide (TPR) repeat protein
LTLFCVLPLLADRGEIGGGGGDFTADVPKTPEEIALEAYNDGVRTLDRVWKLEEKLTSLDEAKKAKSMDKVENQLEQAARRFQTAVENNPALYQAHSDLGYSLRRLGRFEQALQAYDRALALNPNYPQAIEYRAEAYLGLDRITEVRDAYSRLLSVSPEHATQLLAAVSKWLEQERATKALPADTLDQVAQWLGEQGKAVRSASAGSAW